MNGSLQKISKKKNLKDTKQKERNNVSNKIIMVVNKKEGGNE